ncbi:MAG: hypothetical protein II323_04380 [Tidjanibacter sp.]|nr:hypothetical protein [Tidjanibacter sp.]
MKTSNKILIGAIALNVILGALLVGISHSRGEAIRREIAPVMQQIENTTIRVVKMANPKSDYVVSGRSGLGRAVRFIYDSPAVGELRVEGDTLVVDTDKRVVIRLEQVDYIIHRDGYVEECGSEKVYIPN